MFAIDHVESILLFSFAGALAVYLLNFIHRLLANLAAIAVAGAAGYFVFIADKSYQFSFSLHGFQMQWGYDEYSWLFAMMVAVLSVFALVYSLSYMSGKGRSGYYLFNMVLVTASMYGILFSQDFLSLFFFWEIMTWSSFLLVMFERQEAQRAAIKYFVFSAIGAYAILMALVMVYAKTESLSISNFIVNLDKLDQLEVVLISLLLLVGFGVKSALMPLHTWANDAYTASPASFTAMFSGVLSKMGIFGIGLVLFKFLAHTGYSIYIREILAWMGGITALLATFKAIIQTDAKRLLAYSSVGQLGYIITGLAIGTEMSVMAALFMTVMHAIFKSMLFWTVGAVEMRTGSTDMNVVTGLIRRMPLSFLTMLMGIITVAGLPPLGGFIGKWMLYESLIISKHIYLVIVIFAASTAAFLYLFRIIFSIFLGQEEPEFMQTKEAPVLMWLPMILFSAMTFIAGVFPGILLKPIAAAMGELGFQNVKWDMSVLINTWGNRVDLLAITGTIFTVFLLALIYLTLRSYKSTRYVTTKDIHTAGEIPTENENLTYAVDFYQPFERAMEPLIKRSADRFFKGVGKHLENLFDVIRQIYTGNGQTYAMYTLIYLAILIIFAEFIF